MVWDKMESNIRSMSDSSDVHQNSSCQNLLKLRNVSESIERSNSEERTCTASKDELRTKPDNSDISFNSVGCESNELISSNEADLKRHLSQKAIENNDLNLNELKDTLSTDKCDFELQLQHDNVHCVSGEILTDEIGRVVGHDIDNTQTRNDCRGHILPNGHPLSISDSLACRNPPEATGLNNDVSSLEATVADYQDNMYVSYRASECCNSLMQDGSEVVGSCNDVQMTAAHVVEEATEVNEDDDFEDALEFVVDHFAENSDDETKEIHEEKVLIKEISDVGRYSYACLVAHSLHTLFGYSSTNKKFQDQCMKLLLRHLGHNKKMQKTMLMVLRGDIQMGESDPLVDSLKKEFPNPKTGSLSIIGDLLELALREGVYDARMRTLIKFLSLMFGILWEDVEDLEDQTQGRFQEEGHEPTEEEKKEKLDKMKSRRIKRIALVSVAAVGGGALIGLTAGIAAPLIAVGAGAIIGGVGAAGLGTVAGAAIIGSIFGVAGAGLTGFKMKKRIGELEEFEFEPLTQGRSLHVTVAVSGWLNDKHTDFRSVWLGLANSQEQYILRYESKYLRELGQAMEYIANIAITAAVKHTLKQTLLSGLLAAISWPLTLLSVASIIDNPWSICTQRSVNAGRQLAEVLLSRQQGRRPVTLVGFSFGARVIFSCLEEMASRKNAEGIVEEVVLLGAPVSGCEEDWSRLERVVSGRIVNGFCRGDWLLKFMYRTASAQLTIAGLTPVKWVNRRMHNIDLTDIVSGHLDYFNQIDMILNSIGIKTVEHAEVGSLESLKQWTSLQHPDNRESNTECIETVDKISEKIVSSSSADLSRDPKTTPHGECDGKVSDSNQMTRANVITEAKCSELNSVEDKC